MTKELNTTGTWWLPSNPEMRIPGTLKFSTEEGGVLSLHGCFDEKTTMLNPSVILGASTKGKRLTLCECFETKRSVSSGLSTSTFYSNLMLIGAHFPSREGIRFRNFSVNYTRLDEWMNASAFKISEPERGHLTVEYTQPKSHEIQIDDGLRIVIEFRYTPPGFYRVQTQATVKHRPYVTIVPADEKGLDYFLDLIYDIQNFLTLSAMEPVYPERIVGGTEASKFKVGDHVSYEPVELLFRQFERVRSHAVLRGDLLISFEDIYHQLRESFANWIGTRELLGSVRDLYFGTLYNPGAYLQHQFLSLAQALESYHRIRVRSEELPQEEHVQRVKRILDAAGEGDRKWLEEKLRWSNELTFRTRLKELFHGLADTVPSVIGDPDKFAGQVADTRNYLTHYDPELKNRAASGTELSKITERLKIVLQICLIRELGLNESTIRFLLMKSWTFRQRLDWLK
jgi:hypothetical protein